MMNGLSPGQAVELEALQSLFSVFMVLDRDLRIVHGSDVLERHVPVTSEQPPLTQVFELIRPASVTCFDEAVRHLNSLFLLVASDQSFAIRGQLICRIIEGQDYLVFCGAPWLSWLTNHRPELKLSLKDFSPQDVQFDQLFYMTTEKRMVEDLERLNEQLRVAKEEAEVAQASKDAFFAQMSHEMRTPLNGVVSALALLKDQGLSGRPGELLDLASKSSVNLMQVINYVLDISKLESSDSQSENLEFDLVEMITSVMDIVRARALEKGLELRSRIDSAVSSTYLGDAARLRQALLNLAINAIKFTDTGTITLNVTQATMEEQTIRLEVTDTGEGIREEDQGMIFEPFSTAEHSDAHMGQHGTGLGLDIAKRNIESMSGKIGVSSAPGMGATFWIELPFPAVTGSAAGPSEAAATVDANTEFAGRVLLVDDNETNLMLGTMILEGMGVTVIPASSGEEAVKLATSSSPDLVLMDISMPGIDGFEATRQIRASLDAQSLPVVALTAYASSVEQAKSEKCGMNDYLTKPIEREKLVAALEAWLPRIEREASEVHGQATHEGQVDREALDNLLQQIGRDNLASVITKFCDEADRRWSALESASNESDLARESHTLASTCRSFGLPAVADKLNCIERHAKFGDEPGGPPCVMETGRQLKRGLLELKAEFARL
jgi:signal transduction histidine kinase/DNA-binding NarL/FixJ family response regulator